MAGWTGPGREITQAPYSDVLILIYAFLIWRVSLGSHATCRNMRSHVWVKVNHPGFSGDSFS